MELTAVVRGLSQLKRPTVVELVTDSVYVGTGLSEWLPKWKQQGWKRKEKGRFVPVKNEDLWRELDRLAAAAHDPVHARRRPCRPSRERSLRFDGRRGLPGAEGPAAAESPSPATGTR